MGKYQRPDIDIVCVSAGRARGHREGMPEVRSKNVESSFTQFIHPEVKASSTIPLPKG